MADLETQEVLRRDIPWETYLNAKLITGRCLQLLRRYDKRPESNRAALLDDEGPAYIRVFVNILRTINKADTVEYVLALIDEMLSANPKRARLFHDKSLESDDNYEPFLRLLWGTNWFMQEKSCKILSLIVSTSPKVKNDSTSNGKAPSSEIKFTTIDDVLKGLVDWLCSQLLYEACLCLWLLSFYGAAIDYLATTRILPRLVEVVKGSTKEKVVRVVILTLRNFLSN